MSAEWVGKLVDAIQSPRTAVAVFTMCLVPLLLTDSALDWLRVRAAVEPLRALLLLGALGSGGALAYAGVDAIREKVLSTHRRKTVMHALTRTEREQLALMYRNGDNACHMAMTGAACEALVHKGIMAFRGPYSDGWVTYVVEPWAWEYLKEHPGALAPPSS